MTAREDLARLNRGYGGWMCDCCSRGARWCECPRVEGEDAMLVSISVAPPDAEFRPEVIAWIPLLQSQGLVRSCSCSDGDYVEITSKGHMRLDDLVRRAEGSDMADGVEWDQDDFTNKGLAGNPLGLRLCAASAALVIVLLLMALL